MDEAAISPRSSVGRKGGQAGGQLPRDAGKRGRDSRAGRGPGHPWPRAPLRGWRRLSGCLQCPFSSPAGPSHWKELKPTCGGDKQSPVNIDRRKLQRDGGLGDILFEGYDQAPPGKWRLANNGHTGPCCRWAPSPALATRALSWPGLGSITAPRCSLPSSCGVPGQLLPRGVVLVLG